MGQSSGFERISRFVFISTVLALAVGGCGQNRESQEEEKQKLYSEWNNGTILESVSVTVGNQTYCVDVVRNYREAKLGFVRLNESVNVFQLARYPDVEMELFHDTALFVVLNKPYALRLPLCKNQ